MKRIILSAIMAVALMMGTSAMYAQAPAAKAAPAKTEQCCKQGKKECCKDAKPCCKDAKKKAAKKCTCKKGECKCKKGECKKGACKK
jgi:hypothetical protein